MGGHCGIEKLKYKNDIVVPIPKMMSYFFELKVQILITQTLIL